MNIGSHCIKIQAQRIHLQLHAVKSRIDLLEPRLNSLLEHILQQFFYIRHILSR